MVTYRERYELTTDENGDAPATTSTRRPSLLGNGRFGGCQCRAQAA